MTDNYQGWTNHATWAVALWVDNDEPTYKLRRRCDLYTAERCETFVRKIISTEMLNNILRDITPKTLDDVDWEEICGAWKDE